MNDNLEDNDSYFKVPVEFLSGSETIESGVYVVDFSLSGNVGNSGKSAYQVAVENGYTGTEQDFVNQMLNPTIDGGIIF